MNTNDPKPRPLRGDTLIDDFVPERFLQPSDLIDRWKVETITVTITRIMDEPTTPNTKDIDPITRKPVVVYQPVLYFKSRAGEFAKGYLVKNKADKLSLKSSTNARTAGELIGKRITIILATHRQKQVLRISPLPPLDPTSPQTTSAAAATAETSEPQPMASTTETSEAQS